MPFKNIEDKRAWHREWVKANPEKFAASKAASDAKRKANRPLKPPRIALSAAERKERQRIRDKQRRARPDHKQRERERNRARYGPERRAYVRGYRKQRRAKDIQFRLSDLFRSRLRDAIKGKHRLGISAMALLGCTIAEAITHLERQFKPGMTWDNHGLHGWHIDHIIPISAFDLTDPQQIAKACHYSNLQPLWARENQAKGNRRAA